VHTYRTPPAYRSGAAAVVDDAGERLLHGGPCEGTVGSLLERLRAGPLPGKLHLEGVAHARGEITLRASGKQRLNRPAQRERLLVHRIGPRAVGPSCRAEKQRQGRRVSLRRLGVSLRPVQFRSHAAERRFLRVVEKIKYPATGQPLVGAPLGRADPDEVPPDAGERSPSNLVGLRGEADLLET